MSDEELDDVDLLLFSPEYDHSPDRLKKTVTRTVELKQHVTVGTAACCSPCFSKLKSVVTG